MVYLCQRFLPQDKNKRIYFPIIIIGDEFARPWEILSRFVMSGLTYGPNKPGAIYFTFTRPAFEIFEGLKRVEKQLREQNNKDGDQKIIGDRRVDWKDLVIIDCYTQFAKRYDDYIHSYMVIAGYYAKTKTGNIDCEVSYADSNNPHDMNKKYESALRLLKKDGCKNVRVVYDALSDFLTFTDQQLAAQYLRHNMGWEQRNDIESLYLFRSGTIDEKLGEYFLWLANGALNIQRIQSDNDNPKDYLLCEFRGALREPTRFKLDFEYNFLPISNV